MMIKRHYCKEKQTTVSLEANEREKNRLRHPFQMKGALQRIEFR